MPPRDDDSRTKSSFTPITFTAKVIPDMAGELKGAYEAKVTGKGLVLLKKGKILAEFPVGTLTKLKSKGQVRIGEGDESVTFDVVKLNGYPNKLAEHLTEFLAGKRRNLRAADYEFPKWLLVVALLPLILVGVGGLRSVQG